MSNDFDKEINDILSGIFDEEPAYAKPRDFAKEKPLSPAPEPHPPDKETVSTVGHEEAIEEDKLTTVVSSEPEPELEEEIPVAAAPMPPIPTFTTEEITNAIDIRNLATLVTLNTARWHAKKKDRQAAADAAKASGADAKAFEAQKHLLVGFDTELKNVHKAIDAARTSHYELTLPWSRIGVNEVGKRQGARLLPNELFMEYTTAMAKAKKEMEDSLAKLVTVYPNIRQQVQGKLGKAFDPADYPDVGSLHSYFRLSFDFDPIPYGSDFAGLQEAQVEQLGDALNRKTRHMLENALQDVWVRLKQDIEHAMHKLLDINAVFHGTLITKLKNQAKMLSHFNVTKDVRIEEVRSMIDHRLTKFEPKDIRKDDALRKSLGENAKEIYDRMNEIEGVQNDGV